MRLFALICFGVAVFYGYAAISVMQSGVATPLQGDTTVQHRRDDPNSKYAKFLLARWMLGGGFCALGVVMYIFAGRFEKLHAKP